MNYFVTAIDTDSGKTLVSTILCEALQADYWKPVQAGHPRDTEAVAKLLDPQHHVFFPEGYLLQTPASPHAAARIDGITIDLQTLTPPATTRDLVIEGAGGCLVPLNDRDFVIDLVVRFTAQVVLVADLYLGSINHTLLTVEALRNRNLPIKGIIFNGPSNAESERIIELHTGLPVLLRLPRQEQVTRQTIIDYAKELQQHWHA
jgi:dethiobiotin synthetase